MSDQSVQRQRSNQNFHKYFDGIFVVVKNEFHRVFLWLYKGGAKYVGDYLKSTPRGMKRLKANERTALSERERTVGFDIPFLYTLMQHTCGLAEDTSSIWHNPQTPSDEDSLEHTLYRLKEKRNALCHHPQPLMHMSKAELDEKLNELGNFCRIIIQEAGLKAKISKEEVKNCIVKMKETLNEIKTKSSPLGFTAKTFLILAQEEIKRKYCYPSDLLNTFVKPSIQISGKAGQYAMHLNHFGLWLCENGSLPTKIIMQGDTGIGKSSVCRFLYAAWASENAEIIDMSSFDLALPVECCKVSTRDLVDFLEEYLSETISECGREETRHFLQSLKVLWLIDSFEDATVDARELIKNIEKQGASHLMFITTKPQYRQDLIDIFSSEDSVMVVNLSGLSIDGVKHMVIRVLYQKEKNVAICEKEATEFLNALVKLGQEFMFELAVPLKVKLMLELWQSGKLSKECGNSLSLLYSAIMDAQLDKLQKKMILKAPLAKEEILGRSKNWVKLLCEVAFKMTMQKKFVIIDKTFKDNLKRKAVNLLISCKDSLSIFLHVQPYGKTEELCCFIHSSQQFFLAAQHVLFLLENNPDPGRLLKEIFISEILRQNEINSNHLYLTLLQVISKVSLQTAQQQSLVSSLTELLFMCGACNEFEIIYCAQLSNAFAKEMSSYLGNSWLVSDNEIRAAVELLNFKTPSSMSLLIFGDPKELKSFTALLDIISKRPICVNCALQYHCFGRNHDFSDSYLAYLCSTDAMCTVINFSGNLSGKGCQYLSKMTQVRYLELKVTSNNILQQIFRNISDLDHLAHLSLIITMSLFKKLPRQLLRCKSVSVYLQQINETNISATARVLSRISRCYTDIILHDLPEDSAAKFMHSLLEEKVTIKSLRRMLPFGPPEQNQFIIINYGPLQHDQSVSVLLDQWKNTYLGWFEDALGNRKIRVRTKGIPKDIGLWIPPTNM